MLDKYAAQLVDIDTSDGADYNKALGIYDAHLPRGREYMHCVLVNWLYTLLEHIVAYWCYSSVIYKVWWVIHCNIGKSAGDQEDQLVSSVWSICACWEDMCMLWEWNCS